MKYKSNLALMLSEDLRKEFEVLINDVNKRSKGLEKQEDFIQRINADIDLAYLLLDNIGSSILFPKAPNPSNLRYLRHVGTVLRNIELDISDHIKEGNGTYRQHLEDLRGYRESIEDFLGKELNIKIYK